MLQITQQEEEKIYRLNQDKFLIEALKKVFLKCYIRTDIGTDINTLAAARLAIEFLDVAFKELAKIQPTKEFESSNENIV